MFPVIKDVLLILSVFSCVCGSRSCNVRVGYVEHGECLPVWNGVWFCAPGNVHFVMSAVGHL